MTDPHRPPQRRRRSNSTAHLPEWGSDPERILRRRARANSIAVSSAVNEDTRSIANFTFRHLPVLIGIGIRRVTLEMSKEAMLLLKKKWYLTMKTSGL